MHFSIYRMYTLKKPFSRVVVGVIGVIRRGKENTNKRYSQVGREMGSGTFFWNIFYYALEKLFRLKLTMKPLMLEERYLNR